jgi:formate dehydrogenase iron-sulfur subunit
MQAPVRLFLSRDSAAVAVGSDAVADALRALCAARGVVIELKRTSSRGAFWLEPLLEVQTARGRVGYGPLGVDDVASLLDAGALTGAAHARGVGVVDELPYLKRQHRLIFERAGLTDPLSIDDYDALGGWAGLRAAVTMPPEAIWHQVLDSGLRGRGGAAFPAGIKWRTVAQTAAAQKYVVCNADEGDSGTFADRMVLEGDPYLLIEGMAIAALAVGATKGFVYIRSEYPLAVQVFQQAVERARAAGFLGADLLGSGRAFELELRMGAGSYVCGEETAMLESLEGRRGIVRAKPPLPAIQGLFGRPTLIHNVLTLAAVPAILARGAAAYKALGMGRSTGTMPFQLAGNIRRGGLVELPFGVTLRQLVEEFGGGTASGRPVKAVQVGGPLGAYVPASKWDVPLDYEAYAAFGAALGHGGLVVHDDRADLARLARYAMEFCAIESCGKCTPCRIGAARGVEVIDRITGAASPQQREQQVALLRDLCDTMVGGSLCAMGGMTPYPVLSALEHYPEDFGLTPVARAAA